MSAPIYTTSLPGAWEKSDSHRAAAAEPSAGGSGDGWRNLGATACATSSHPRSLAPCCATHDALRSCGQGDAYRRDELPGEQQVWIDRNVLCLPSEAHLHRARETVALCSHAVSDSRYGRITRSTRQIFA